MRMLLKAAACIAALGLAVMAVPALAAGDHLGPPALADEAPPFAVVAGDADVALAAIETRIEIDGAPLVLGECRAVANEAGPCAVDYRAECRLNRFTSACRPGGAAASPEKG